jgi:hypothetical protein
MGLDKAANGYNPTKQNKLKDLAKEYGIDLSIVRRIAIINNYNVPFIIDALDEIYEKDKKSIFEDRLKEYKPKNNLE